VADAVSCVNGTAALHLALSALGIGPRDEVIVPTLTYIATVNAVRYCGGTPVFVDSESETMNLDPGQVKRNLTARTKVIIPVHLYGQCADMEPILALAAAREICAVEDARRLTALRTTVCDPARWERWGRSVSLATRSSPLARVGWLL
jgi:perosamine synthetase